MALYTAGELVAVESELGWAGRLVARATGADAAAVAEPAAAAGPATVRLRIEADRRPFARSGLRPVTRGAYSDGEHTLLTDAASSGFDLYLTVADDELRVVARYRPRTAIRTANLLLASRFALLTGQVLVHYPVLWRAGWRGRVPLHASAIRTPAATTLLAGPGGVGKSRILADAIAAVAEATADNLCCADEERCHGVREPMRTDASRGNADRGRGRRTSHGRVEQALSGWVPSLRPDRLVVLERGPSTTVEQIKPDDAARALAAGTYAAGELRRYWAFAATLALATGLGPAHPPIMDVATGYAQRLPCWRVRVGDGDRINLDDTNLDDTNLDDTNLDNTNHDDRGGATA